MYSDCCFRRSRVVLHEQLGANFTDPDFQQNLGATQWSYRGQIIPTDQEMTLEIHIKGIEISESRIHIQADGQLWKDGLRIYDVKNLDLCIIDRHTMSSPGGATLKHT